MHGFLPFPQVLTRLPPQYLWNPPVFSTPSLACICAVTWDISLPPSCPQTRSLLKPVASSHNTSQVATLLLYTFADSSYPL